MNYFIPAVIILTLIVSAIKKVDVYAGFIEGAKEALGLIIGLLPYFIAIFLLIEVFEISGLNEYLSKALVVPLSYLGIPKEVIPLIIIRPISGSGSLGVLENIMVKYGVDSYVGRCASVISGCNDTVFFIVGVYTSSCKDKKTLGATIIALIASFVGVIIGCFICRFL